MLHCNADAAAHQSARPMVPRPAAIQKIGRRAPGKPERWTASPGGSSGWSRQADRRPILALSSTIRPDGRDAGRRWIARRGPRRRAKPPICCENVPAGSRAGPHLDASPRSHAVGHREVAALAEPAAARGSATTSVAAARGPPRAQRPPRSPRAARAPSRGRRRSARPGRPAARAPPAPSSIRSSCRDELLQQLRRSRPRRARAPRACAARPRTAPSKTSRTRHGRAGGGERVDVVPVAGAGDRSAARGCRRADVAHQPHRLLRVVDRDHHRPRLGEPGGRQHLGPVDLAVDSPRSRAGASARPPPAGCRAPRSGARARSGCGSPPARTAPCRR